VGEAASFWFGVVGVASGLIGLFVGVAGVIYGRRQAIAAEGPTSPDLEVEKHGWLDGFPGWYEVQVLVRNRTDRTWNMRSARLRKPSKGKLVAIDRLGVYDNAGSYLTPSPDELALDDLSAVTRPDSQVGYAGSTVPGRGRGDISRERLYAFFPKPDRCSIISIEFTLEDNGLSSRRISKMLDRRVAPNNSNAIRQGSGFRGGV